MIEDFFAIFL